MLCRQQLGHLSRGLLREALRAQFALSLSSAASARDMRIVDSGGANGDVCGLCEIVSSDLKAERVIYFGIVDSGRGEIRK